MDYTASAQRFASKYGDVYAAKNDLLNKNFTGAYQELESFRQKMANDPFMRTEYNADRMALAEKRSDYLGVQDDDYKPSNQDYVVAGLLTSTLANPSVASGNLASMERIAQVGAKAQGISVNGTSDLATQALAGIQTAGLNATASVSAMSSVDPLVRGADPRGFDAYNWGATQSVLPGSDPTQLGTNTIARQLSIANGTSTAGTLNANLRQGRNG